MMANAPVVGEGRGAGSPALWNTSSVPAVFQQCGWVWVVGGPVWRQTPDKSKHNQ